MTSGCKNTQITNTIAIKRFATSLKIYILSQMSNMLQDNLSYSLMVNYAINNISRKHYLVREQSHKFVHEVIIITVVHT